MLLLSPPELDESTVGCVGASVGNDGELVCFGVGLGVGGVGECVGSIVGASLDV